MFKPREFPLPTPRRIKKMFISNKVSEDSDKLLETLDATPTIGYTTVLSPGAWYSFTAKIIGADLLTPVTYLTDIRFKLYCSATGISQVGSTIVDFVNDPGPTGFGYTLDFADPDPTFTFSISVIGAAAQTVDWQIALDQMVQGLI